MERVRDRAAPLGVSFCLEAPCPHVPSSCQVLESYSCHLLLPLPLTTQRETEADKGYYLTGPPPRAPSLPFSLLCLLFHSFSHPFINSPIHLFIHPLFHIYPLTHPFINSLTHLFTHLLFHLCIHLLTHSFVHLFIHVFLHYLITHSYAFTHSFIYSLMNSFIHSRMHSSV